MNSTTLKEKMCLQVRTDGLTRRNAKYINIIYFNIDTYGNRVHK